MKKGLIFLFIIPLLLLGVASRLTQITYAASYYTLIINNSNTLCGSVSPAVGTYMKENATDVALIATPNEGYAFQAWAINLFGYITVYNFENPHVFAQEIWTGGNGILNITVLWAPATVYLTVNAASHGTTNPNGTTARYVNEQVTITAYPESGYCISSWNVGGLSLPMWPHITTNTTSVTMTRNMTVIPIFSPLGVSPPIYTPTQTFQIAGTIFSPAIVCGVLGGALYPIGKRFEHGKAAVLIGLGIGFVVCTNAGLIPLQVAILICVIAGAFLYLWLRG